MLQSGQICFGNLLFQNGLADILIIPYSWHFLALTVCPFESCCQDLHTPQQSLACTLIYTHKVLFAEVHCVQVGVGQKNQLKIRTRNNCGWHHYSYKGEIHFTDHL